VSRFFIDRPIFAWVVALILMLVGAMSITRLPITPYPAIAPPRIAVSASYPGASARAVEESVTQIIEQNMTGLDGLIYMTANSRSNGSFNLSLTFASGTNPDIAQIQVQNRLQTVTPLLPQIVQQQGINVSKTTNNQIMAVGFYSPDGSYSASDLTDYITNNVYDQLTRVPGVGGVQSYGAYYAMRVWLDPERLRNYGLSPGDVVAAINGQNAQFSVGQLGGTPAVPGQQINATITARGRLQNAEQFRNIVLRGGSSGAVLRLKDVARVELGSNDYGMTVLYNGTQPATGFGVSLATGQNALATSDRVRALIAQLEPGFPPGIKAFIPYDTTPYIRVSIEEVVKTLIEAIVLVFLVMYLFLQNLRATLIPTIAVPVVLLGTFPVLLFMGFSINLLTMFAVVLAIGLLVDDAIVVVENVQRLMDEEHLSPLDATRRSMQQITGALIGIGTVLSAVLLPMAFLSGSTGVIYRQFSVTIVTAMVLSVLVALTLTPALCATLLRPGKHATGSDRGGFRWFNDMFDRRRRGYEGVVKRMLRLSGRYMLVYLALAAMMGVLFLRLPTAFLPAEDQGYLFVLVQAPVGATQQRTNAVLGQVQSYFMNAEKQNVASVFTVQGFSFSGSGQNSGIGFVLLKDWSERHGADQTVTAVAGRAYFALSKIKDALVYAVAPPPLTELSSYAGFDFYLKDTAGAGHAALMAARNQLLGMAMQSKSLANVRPSGSEDSPQFRLDIDEARAAALGVSMAEVNSTLGIAWGGRYVDDFLDRGRIKRVYVQADAPFRMNPEDMNRWYVRSQNGGMVPLVSFVSSRWEDGSPELIRYNGLPAMEIGGEAAPGVSSGEAMLEIERLAARLPTGFRVEWTGQSYEERSAGSQTPLLYTLSLVVVFLSLAALYESWAIPVPILLAVPLGVIGAVFATAIRGFERDVYFQVAMLTTIGLASKNAILIVEFAKLNLDAGMELFEATVHAARDRLRPILMTSFAFGFGVLPLAVATGAGAGAQRAIGTGIFGGVIAGTLLGVFFVPLLFVFFQRLLARRPAGPTAPPPPPQP
jgi:multidrug efflux pump